MTYTRALFLISALCAVAARGDLLFVPYRQCDPAWAQTIMGTSGDGEQATICREGCAMTSVAMALATFGVTDCNGALITPLTLNAWLQAHGGYYCSNGDCNNLNLTSTEALSPSMNLIGEGPPPPAATLAAEVASGQFVLIAHVRKGTHFVLLTGVAAGAPGQFTVLDPLYNTSTYAYADIVDVVAFKVNAYPLYKQCDSRWAAATMGGNGKTICAVGCFMSSLSMALAGTNIPIAGQRSTPLTIDRFLQTHSGFVPDSSALREEIVPSIAPQFVSWNASTGMHPTNDIPLAAIVAMLDAPVPPVIIANVMHGQHFVLVVGYRSDGDTVVVNDPGFDRNTYSYSNDVVGWRIFGMLPPVL